MSAALRAVFLILPCLVSAQPCVPSVEKTIVLQLPGRAGLPPGSHMKLDMPITLVPESCPAAPPPQYDALRGPPASPGSLLRGEPAKPPPKPG